MLSATDKKLNLGPSPEERTVYGGERHKKRSPIRELSTVWFRGTQWQQETLLVVRDSQERRHTGRGHEKEGHAREGTARATWHSMN